MQNHYYNQNHPLKPYTHSTVATSGTLPPSNATRDKQPAVAQGYWPCWSGTGWVQIEDHRQRDGYADKIAQFSENYPQDGTPYWLEGDTHYTQARTMKDIGPLPEGALLERPALPGPTVFEKIVEVQAFFFEQLTLAKSDFLTASIEGDMELEAEARAEYQSFVEAIRKATTQVNTR